LDSVVLEKRYAMSNLAEIRKTVAYYLTQPVVRLLARTSITPNTLTWFGFLLIIGAAVLIATQHLFAAGLMTLFAGFFDMLDGALARSTNRVSRMGGFLDSTLDRLADAALLLGVLFLYARGQSVAGVVLVGVTLFGSLLVSYIRARAEALGLECKVGFFTRPERVIVLALGLLLNRVPNALFITLVVIAALSYITAVQRIIHVWRQTKK
jgi:CDP-diacylglycerol--glycerol-3-phosphate 3-phosphatidyltransferase